MNHKPKYIFLNRLNLALQGIFLTIKRELHMKFHILFGLTLLTPLIWIKIPVTNVWILIILITLLLITELINTAIELTVDLVTKKFSYRAKLAKDIASGAVLIMASLVLLFGFYIYYKPIITIIRSSSIGN